MTFAGAALRSARASVELATRNSAPLGGAFLLRCACLVTEKLLSLALRLAPWALLA
jgi:hypothetical protein